MKKAVLKKVISLAAAGTMFAAGFAVPGASEMFTGISESSISVSAAATDITYSTHIQTFGWRANSQNGAMSGTTGLSKRLEAVKINHPGIQYRVRGESYGWQAWKKNGEIAGTTGQAQAINAVQIKLNDEYAKQYDVYYQVHVQTYGWLGWAKNGEITGTEGGSKRVEAICVKIVKKGTSISENRNAYLNLSGKYGKFEDADSYAATYAFRKNPAYNYYPGVNCCNFVSQCLVAGGFKTNSSWNKDTQSFCYIPSFRTYMRSIGINYIKNPTSVSQISKGDVVEMYGGDHVMFVRYVAGSQIHFAANTTDHDDAVVYIGDITGVYKTGDKMVKIKK